jgi:hypothetical protein
MTTFEIAQALGQIQGHGITCSEKGYFFQAGQRIGKERALEILRSLQQPAAWSFEKLNTATQAFFYQLCEQIQAATHDASMACAARIGKDIPNIGLANAPRLTNLKKAGVIERGERGWVQLTELGRAMFLATV